MNLCPACFSGGDSDNGSDAGARAWADTAWERYKARFMMPDGRIIDTANGNVSHTEGQGFAMLGGGE